jgi:hypothetical protein
MKGLSSDDSCAVRWRQHGSHFVFLFTLGFREISAISRNSYQSARGKLSFGQDDLYAAITADRQIIAQALAEGIPLVRSGGRECATKARVPDQNKTGRG